MKIIDHPQRADIYDIVLDTRTTQDYKGVCTGTECETIISLTIMSSTGYCVDGLVSSDRSPSNVVSVPYAWSLAIDASDDIYILRGRDIRELHMVLSDLCVSSAYQGLAWKKITDNPNKDILDAIKNDHRMSHIIHIYDHNLRYDFQILRNLYNAQFAEQYGNGHATFAKDLRNPMYAVVPRISGQCGIKLHDTSALTKKSLTAWSDDEDMGIDTDDVLDSTVKCPCTRLTDRELESIDNGSLIILYGMRKYKDRYHQLDKIPLTQTGAVRRILKGHVCKPEPWAPHEKHKKNEKATGSVWSRAQCRIDKTMTPSEYARMRQIFHGGSMLLNSAHVGRLVRDVDVYDFYSAYPAVMCYMVFPIGKFVKVERKYEMKILESSDIMDIDRPKMWYAHYTFRNLRKTTAIPFWPASKCVEEHTFGVTKSNGKVRSADVLDVYMSDVDYDIFRTVYTWDDKEIQAMWSADAGLLPEPLINIILSCYGDKTRLKDTGKKSQYVEAKQVNNSIYGVAVTRLFDDLNLFTAEGWKQLQLDEQLFEMKKTEIKPKNHIMSYQIGVWVTAWGRYNLWRIASVCMDRVIYGDTDSLIGTFDERDKHVFEAYDAWLKDRAKAVCAKYPNINPSKFAPMSGKGKVYRLGSFGHDNHFSEYRTIGAKRYVGVCDDGTLKTAVSGIPVTALCRKIKSPRDLTERLSWTAEESDVVNPTYNDDMPVCTWTDRDGNSYKSNMRYGVGMVPSGFSLSAIYGSVENTMQILGSDKWCNVGRPDTTDPLYIRDNLIDN